MISILTDAPGRRSRVAKNEPRTAEGTALDVRPLPAHASAQMVQMFKLLADETRLQIMYFLTQRLELNVGSLCELLQQSQPAVSHHLALMRSAELIEMRREGKHNYYRILPAKFQDLVRVVYTVLPAEARAYQWSDLVAAPANGTASAVSMPTTSGTSGA